VKTAGDGLVAAFEAEARTRQLDPAFPRNVRAWLLLMNGQPEQALDETDKGALVESRTSASSDAA